MEKRQPSKSFRNLVVWQKAYQLVLEIYKKTKSSPKEELFCLTSQIRRSLISVAASIAEAFKKKGTADKLRILNISQGSLSKTEYSLMLTADFGYGTTLLKKNAYEVGRILKAYMKSLGQNSKS